MTTEYSFFDGLSNLKSTLRTKDNVKTFLSVVLLFLYQLLMAVSVMTIAPSNAGAFREVFFITYVLAILPIVVTRALHSDIIPAIAVGFLIETGQAVQAAISDKYSGNSTIIWLCIVSFLSALVFQKKIWEKLKTHKKGLFVLYVALTIILGIAGLSMRLLLKPVNGAYNWIYLGGTSVQLSEVLKLFYLLSLFIGATLSTNDKELFIKTLLPTLSFGAALIVVNEGGTLVLSAASWLFVVFFLTEDPKQLMKEFGVVLAGGFAGLFALAIFRKFFNGKGGLAGTVYEFSDKVFNRLYSLISPDKNDTYQIDRALTGIRDGRLFGSDSEYLKSIPEYTSDFVLSSISARFGIVIAAFIIIAFAVFFISSVRKYRNDDNGRILIICSSNLFLQAMIVVFSNLSIGPVIGLTLPAISSGGSSLVISCALFALSLVSMGTNNSTVTIREENEE